MVDPSVAIFGPLDTLVGPYAGYVVFAFAVLSLLTRKLQQDRIEEQAEAGDDDEELSRHPLHTLVMVGFVLSSFYYLTLHHHSGIVMSVLAVGTFVADFFEFEARNVEAREDLGLEMPKGATAIAVVALLYAAYISLFAFVKPYWQLVV